MKRSTCTAGDLIAILDHARRMVEQRRIRPLVVYIARMIFKLIPADRCMVALYAQDGAPLVQIVRDHRGLLPGGADQICRAIFERVRISMAPLQISDALALPPQAEAHGPPGRALRSVLCAPLISSGKAVGMIAVEHRLPHRQFHEDYLIPMLLLSHQLEAALAHAQAYEALETQIAERTQALEALNAQLGRLVRDLREQAVRDSLTGLYNRRHCSDYLGRLFELSRRYQRPLCVACIDIDDFKQINDSIFHTGGDRVLVAVAQVLQDTCRSPDTAARTGGEEFLVIMPELSLPAAFSQANRLRAAIEQHAWHAIAPSLQVTVSIGVAEAGSCASAQELLHCADISLYTAKRMGKNRVVASNAPAGPPHD
jgi:diguanylate cyclase (GGDEF)-like protein